MTVAEWALSRFESRIVDGVVEIKVSSIPESWVSLGQFLNMFGEGIQAALDSGTSIYAAMMRISVEKGLGWEQTRNYRFNGQDAIFASLLDELKARGVLS